MRTLRLVVSLALLAIPATAAADIHRADFSGGFSIEKASTLVGAHFTYMYSVPTGETRRLGVVADVSFDSGEHADVDITRTTYLVGLRWSMPIPRPDQSQSKHIISVQALGGGVHSNGGIGNDGAAALGVLWDFIPKINPDDDSGFGLRVQAEYVFAQGDTDGFERYTIGAVYRFGHR